MNPIDDDHVSYIVYEPTSGSIVRNAKVSTGNNIFLAKNLLIFPS